MSIENISLRKIQTNIVDNIILAISIVAIPAVGGSLIRYFTIGWQAVFSVHIVLALCIILISFRRKRLTYKFKVYFILFLFLMLAIGAGVNLGLNGFLLEFLTLMVFLSVVFLSKKRVYVVYLLSILVIVALGYLHVTGVLAPSGFEDQYSSFTSSWINAVVAFSTIVAMVVYIAGQIGYLLEESNQKLHVAANTDYLTGCVNRMGFTSIGNMEIEKSRRYKVKLCAAAIDIDHFKRVNDKYGHNKGDEVLRSIAFLIKKHLRASDIFARIGGEEFILLTSNINIEQTTRLAEKLRKMVEENKVPGIHEKVTISIGVAQFTEEDTLQSLMEKSDLALYDAKQKGRNQVKVFE